MKRVFGFAGAVLAATMAGGAPAGAAVLSTQTLDYAIQITAVVQNLSGSGTPRLTVTGHQTLTFDRIDPAQNLTGFAATFTARMPEYVFAVSQQGSGAGSSIILGPLSNEIVASIASGGPSITLGALDFSFIGPTLELVACGTDLCFDQNGGSRAAISDTQGFTDAALLALFEGTGQAAVDIDVEQIFDLSYASIGNPGPLFGYAYRFEFAGSLTLTFEGEGPSDPGEPVAVPEPMGAGLLIAGLAVLAARRRRP